MKYFTYFLLIMAILIGTAISPANAQKEIYSAHSMTVGYGFSSQRQPADKMCDTYICKAFTKVQNIYAKETLNEAIGRESEDADFEAFVPYLPKFIAQNFEDRPGDTVMILNEASKYMALIDNIGIFNDACEGAIPVCKLAKIDSLPKIDYLSNRHFIVLRYGHFYGGPIFNISQIKITDLQIQTLVDSLKTEFIKHLPVNSQNSKYTDSIEVFTDPDDSSFNKYFVAVYRTHEDIWKYSALYEVVRNYQFRKIITLAEITEGWRSWQFYSSFDFDGDGVYEYLISSLGWEEETVTIYTYKYDAWIMLYLEYFGGC